MRDERQNAGKFKIILKDAKIYIEKVRFEEE